MPTDAGSAGVGLVPAPNTVTLRAKLILAFAMVASVPLVGGAIGYYAYRTADNQTRALRELSLHALPLFGAAKALEAYGSCGSMDAAANRGEQREAIRQNLALLQAHYQALSLSDELIQAVSGSQETRAWKDAPADQATADALQELMARIEGRMALSPRDDARVMAGFNRHLGAILVFGTMLGIAVGIGFGIVTSIAVTRHIGQIAGDMRTRTTLVAKSAGDVVAVSGQLTQAAAQQTHSIMQSKASLAEVNAMAKANAGHAREARNLSHANRQATDQSAVEMATLQRAMGEMTGASRNIAKILKSIDEIAFQTNLLALNAAIEAARAGEAGLGFAVVAHEVRSLAQRAAAAARETAAQIDDAVVKSQRSVDIATRVEVALRSVIADTHRVDEIIARIAHASGEQARRLDSAVTAMVHIDQLANDNAASATQTAASAQQLETQIGELRNKLALLLDARGREQATVGVDSSTAAGRPGLQLATV